MGQFHISYNACLDLVVLYRFFFSGLYQALFGPNRHMAKKPKPYRLSTLIVAAYGGWCSIRQMVKDHFGFCKDVQFQLLVYLLDELVPLIYSFYTILHASGNYPMWFEAILRFVILFVAQKRRHYDKATLSFISDLLYMQEENPAIFTLFRKALAALSEKKVEVVHSLLRAHINEWSTAANIRSIAHVLSAQNFHTNFNQEFVPEYLRGASSHNISGLATLFAATCDYNGQTLRLPRGRSKRQVCFIYYK